VAAHEPGIDIEKRQAHVAGEGEVGLPVAAVQIVEEDTADAARLAPVLDEEVLVAPGLEARMVVRVVAVAGGLERGVEVGGVRLW
jgi:hypothetical protein